MKNQIYKRVPRATWWIRIVGTIMLPFGSLIIYLLLIEYVINRTLIQIGSIVIVLITCLVWLWVFWVGIFISDDNLKFRMFFKTKVFRKADVGVHVVPYEGIFNGYAEAPFDPHYMLGIVYDGVYIQPLELTCGLRNSRIRVAEYLARQGVALYSAEFVTFPSDGSQTLSQNPLRRFLQNFF